MLRKIGKPAIVLTTACTLLFSVAAFAATDGSSKHWASDTLQEWVSEGLLKGDATGNLNENQSITRAEFVALVNRVFNYSDTSSQVFADVAATKWYADEFSKAFAAGIVQGDAAGLMKPNASITRAEVAVVLANAFRLTAQNGNAYSGFSDGRAVAAWAQDAVSALLEKQYVQGRSGNQFAPSAQITRAEAVVMIDNVMGYLIHAAGTYNRDADGNAVLNAGDILLNQSKVAGNLYLTSGIGEGDATLKGVEIKGNLYVEGGGVNSVMLDGTTVGGQLIINRKQAQVRVVISGESSLSNLVFQRSGKLVIESPNTIGTVTVAPSDSTAVISITGKIKRLIIESGAIVDLSNAEIEVLEIKSTGSGATVTVDASSQIGKALLSGISSIKGTGKVNEAEIHASGVTIEQSVSTVIVKDGLTAIVNGKEVKGTASNTGGGNSGTTPTPGVTPTPTATPAPTPTTEPTETPAPTPTPDPVGTVKYFSFTDQKVPVKLRNYHLVLIGEKTLDYTMTLQPSIFPVSDDHIVASVLDTDGKVWVASANELTRFNIYEQDAGKVEVFRQDEHFKGEIQALLVEGDVIWVLTNDSISQIKYKSSIK
ncbi:S-layer homology domain-containing protein [Paenibacillus sinopodophylli]|uniref:S-layer homology domain-containing protein n=1 Tax=Paenibacillus sinopodophylli TaxID=1837342 RepID=UPI00110C98DF|nr:S-layer homology domain-containing protein [Paenibacillus sinopodophylli]